MAAQGILSFQMLRELERSLKALPPSSPANPFLSLFGMPVRSSGLFPYTASCGKCGGTGDGGEEATYCPKCRGAGAVRHEGVITNGDAITLIVSHLPPRFQPRFPFALPKQPLPRR